MKAELVINKREVITPFSRDKEVSNRFDLKKLKQVVMRLLPGSVFIAATVFIVSFVASIAIKLESREIITQFWYAMAGVVWLVS
jgi:hypothetical protein